MLWPLDSPPNSVLMISCSTWSTARPVSSMVRGTVGAPAAFAFGASVNSVAVAVTLIFLPAAARSRSRRWFDAPCSLFGHRDENLDELDRGRADRDDPDRREDAEHERKHHLHAGFRRGFFRALATLGPHGVGVHPQRLRHAGAELVGLHEHRHARRDVVHASAIGEL